MNLFEGDRRLTPRLPGPNPSPGAAPGPRPGLRNTMPAAAVTPPRGEGRPPPLAVPAILRWCDAHRRRTGRWPRRDDGPVGGGPPGLTWLQVDAALRLGLRGLPG